MHLQNINWINFFAVVPEVRTVLLWHSFSFSCKNYKNGHNDK